ncbi:MAG: lysoplasmalogenase family protein [Christensenellales bacterium]|jgi:uncharacterized membrane protein YhhN
MEYIPYIITALGAAAAVLFIIVRIKRGGVLGVITKTLASLFFIAVAVVATLTAKDSGEAYFGAFIIFGLVFGLVGDIVLDLKIVYPADNDAWTYTGMSSFAVGHVMYLLAFLPLAVKLPNLWMIFVFPVLAGLLFGGAAVLGAPKMGLDYGKFKIPSLIYAFELTFLMSFAFALSIADNFVSKKFILLFVGALLFLISDLILSQQYFSKDASKLKNPVLVAANHVAYYAAQFLIALTVAV